MRRAPAVHTRKNRIELRRNLAAAMTFGQGAAPALPLLSVLPEQGLVCIGEHKVDFTMTQEKIHELLGPPESVRNNLGSYDYIDEAYFGYGFTLRYARLDAPPESHGEVLLNEIIVVENRGWQIEVDGLFLFTDDNLAHMKKKYKHVESKSKRAVAFPALGIFTVGCSGSGGTNGKMIALCNDEVMRSYICTIGMWN
jgi:hypothetical protein